MRAELYNELRLIFTCHLVVFVTLKLEGLIAWSWWWVLSPLWLPIPVGLVVWLVWRRMRPSEAQLAQKVIDEMRRQMAQRDRV